MPRDEPVERLERQRRERRGRPPPPERPRERRQPRAARGAAAVRGHEVPGRAPQRRVGEDGGGRRVVEGQEREPLLAIEARDGTRREAAQASAAVVEEHGPLRPAHPRPPAAAAAPAERNARSSTSGMSCQIPFEPSTTAITSVPSRRTATARQPPARVVQPVLTPYVPG